MKTSILLIILQLSFINPACFGQSNEKPALYLTNYTFSKTNHEIGYVRLKDGREGKIQSIRFTGEHADAFKISEDFKLSLRRDKLKTGLSSVEVILKVRTAKGEVQDTFRIVEDRFIRNKVIAHRGAWKNTGASENSIAALKHAIQMGCEGSEFDVHMSSDSLPFINHDPHIQGISIAKSTADELKGIKLSNGESLPTLQRYIEAGMRQNKTKLILEIKASELGKASSIALTHKVVEIVEDFRAQAWVDYISFDYDICKEIMKIAPYAKVAYLMGDKTPIELASNNFFGLDYHFTVVQKNPTWIKDAQQNKLTVNVWTVNDTAMMEELLKENVDFITTNEPELLLNLISGK